MSPERQRVADALVGISFRAWREATARSYDAATKYLAYHGLGTRDGVIVRRLSVDEQMAQIEARRSPMPDAPCFMCGDRGWCSHRSAAA